ncbi:MAG TPA: hypothetical protein VNQ55_10725 [Parapedobacter sp.]|nr:hypothetical protein [Parapedobacter sp.]
MSDFDLFQQEVINAYHEKKELHALSELGNPSPTRLMKYCLSLLYRGKLDEDKQTLNRIFNPFNKHQDLESGIKNFGADGFKSLQNFMMGRTSRPREEIVKLLAVLIDFQPRPYEIWVRKKSDDSEETPEPPCEPGDIDLYTEEKETGNSGQKEENEPEEGLPGTKADAPTENGWSKIKKPVFYGLIAFSGMLGAYQIADNFDRECMYWGGERYVPIACDEKVEYTEVIPIDRKLVRNFRKIMQPDTLTLKSAGKVWYGKPSVDSVEFYTMKGVYPRDRQKTLKPATEYIIKKYVLEKQ